MFHIPRGEAVLPLFTFALFVLMFVVSPLADIGVLQRPLARMIIRNCSPWGDRPISGIESAHEALIWEAASENT